MVFANIVTRVAFSPVVDFGKLRISWRGALMYFPAEHLLHQLHLPDLELLLWKTRSFAPLRYQVGVRRERTFCLRQSKPERKSGPADEYPYSDNRGLIFHGSTGAESSLLNFGARQRSAPRSESPPGLERKDSMSHAHGTDSAR